MEKITILIFDFDFDEAALCYYLTLQFILLYLGLCLLLLYYNFTYSARKTGYGDDGVGEVR